ncbi:hypothetical protein NDU88_003827 [Pleurodeles waltl]|uniref:Uncharacterized protein n=1 Tax=Pleurodeles waltl TaxID=8319 RepID=A0AAV7VII4_PLEWA|nr:hypothetical protein NDU88_003827 [Pleurodeles waltl]
MQHDRAAWLEAGGHISNDPLEDVLELPTPLRVDARPYTSQRAPRQLEDAMQHRRNYEAVPATMRRTDAVP